MLEGVRMTQGNRYAYEISIDNGPFRREWEALNILIGLR